MGMYDYVKCEMDLPDGSSSGEFQTKDFECDLDIYTITKQGFLVLEQKRLWTGEEPTTEKIDFHGIFNFYGLDKQNIFHSYLAKFTDGQLVKITMSGDSK